MGRLGHVDNFYLEEFDGTVLCHILKKKQCLIIAISHNSRTRTQLKKCFKTMEKFV